MNRDRLLTFALLFLGAAMLLCLAALWDLSKGSRPIPDVFIATTGTIVGAFATLLVGTARTGR